MDVVVVESPTFYGALQAIERLHLRALEVATDPVTGVDLTALEALLQRERVAACWFMTRFQNPLGALMPTAHKQALVACLLYTSPSPRDRSVSRMPSSA